jgi:nicotinate-nucleotide adenylyltransferase
MLLTFESWHRYKDLFSYVDIYCVNRYDRSGSKMQQVAQRYHNEYGARIHLISAPPFEVSSTDIRDKLSRRESLDGLIPHKVEEYIIKNGLYK